MSGRRLRNSRVRARRLVRPQPAAAQHPAHELAPGERAARPAGQASSSPTIRSDPARRVRRGEVCSASSTRTASGATSCSSTRPWSRRSAWPSTCARIQSLIMQLDRSTAVHAELNHAMKSHRGAVPGRAGQGGALAQDHPPAAEAEGGPAPAAGGLRGAHEALPAAAHRGRRARRQRQHVPQRAAARLERAQVRQQADERGRQGRCVQEYRKMRKERNEAYEQLHDKYNAQARQHDRRTRPQQRRTRPAAARTRRRGGTTRGSAYSKHSASAWPTTRRLQADVDEQSGGGGGAQGGQHGHGQQGGARGAADGTAHRDGRDEAIRQQPGRAARRSGTRRCDEEPAEQERAAGEGS